MGGTRRGREREHLPLTALQLTMRQWRLPSMASSPSSLSTSAAGSAPGMSWCERRKHASKHTSKNNRVSGREGRWRRKGAKVGARGGGGPLACLLAKMSRVAPASFSSCAPHKEPRRNVAKGSHDAERCETQATMAHGGVELHLQKAVKLVAAVLQAADVGAIHDPHQAFGERRGVARQDRGKGLGWFAIERGARNPPRGRRPGWRTVRLLVIVAPVAAQRLLPAHVPDVEPVFLGGGNGKVRGARQEKRGGRNRAPPAAPSRGQRQAAAGRELPTTEAATLQGGAPCTASS